MVSAAGELVGFSRTVTADDMLAGYRRGWFPMAVADALYEWWSPDPRGVLPLDRLRVTRSLRRSMGRFRVTFDAAFPAVLARCADTTRRGGWIDTGLAAAYLELNARGYAHSVEAWTLEGELAGGLFGVNVGGYFSGESMFHSATDASKVALVALVQRLNEAPGPVLLDTQWRTEHLASLGVVEIPRDRYLKLLAGVVDGPSLL